MDNQTEVDKNMLIEWNVPCEMDDGTVLRCDIFRPDVHGEYPIILAYGPYGKLLHFEDGYPQQWRWINENSPEIMRGSSNKYQNFEVVDPEKFVPDGFACVRFDSRGTGCSPGYLDPWCHREAQDLYQCIEWAASLSWCNGKVGLSGTSYLAMNQWQVAALRPPHLSAICVWEGALDYYRDMARHGGILCTFSKAWYEPVVLPVQHGLGNKGYKSRMNGDWVSGPITLSEEELAANRSDWHSDCRINQLATDEFWISRMPDVSKIDVPLLSTANWGGQGLHLRGNVEGFLDVASEQTWLDVHCQDHWTEYYTDYGVDLQKRFFGYFLKGEDTGWDKQPRIHMLVRSPGPNYTWRDENEWPLARTKWTKMFMHPSDGSLREEPNVTEGKSSYKGLSEGVTFVTKPFEREMELTGPMAVKLFVSSKTVDVDIFIVVRVFRPDFKEVVFPGHIDPHTPIAQGWLRASHRKMDVHKSLPYRPYHTHDEIQELEQDRIYELDIEILPTCIAIPKDYRLGVSVRGKDYEYPAVSGDPTSGHLSGFTGVGLFRHDDDTDRPPSVFDGNVTLHFGQDKPGHILLPVIPTKSIT